MSVFSAVSIVGFSAQPAAGGGTAGVVHVLPVQFSGAAAEFLQMTVLWGANQPATKEMASAEFVFGDSSGVAFPVQPQAGCALTTSDSPVVFCTRGYTHIIIRRMGQVSETCVLLMTPVESAG